MKKYKIFLIILIIIMLVPIITKIFKNKHSVKYEKDGYEIKENYYKENGNHHYDFIIKKNNKNYSFTLNKDVNKIKKIISNIKEYKSDNINCIFVDYKKINNNDLICLKDNKQVSNYYLNKDKNYKKIVNKIDKKTNVYKASNKTIKKDNLKIYQENIMDDYNYYIWNYKGLYVVNNKDVNYYDVLDEDIYDDVMAIATNRYYVIFENNSVKDIERVYYYDSKKKKINMWVLKHALSKNSYINGFNKDIVYVTDKKKKVQYALNIKKEEMELVGSEEKQYIDYINFKKELFNKSDFFMNNKIFNYIGEQSIIYHNNNYVYSDENNKYYMEMDKGNKILLFELSDVVEWSLVERDILLLKDNTIYLYNEETGLKKIISYNELRYNHLNIYKLGKK